MKIMRIMMLVVSCIMHVAIAMEDLDQQLINAIWDGNQRGVEALLDQGLSPDELGISPEDSRWPRKKAALFVAIKKEDAAMVELLLKRGANPNIALRVENGNEMREHLCTPLMIVAESGNSAIAEMLLAHGANVDTCLPSDHGACTPLHLAAARGHLRVVELLIRKGANPFCGDSLIGVMPLIWAIKNGRIDCVRCLLVTRAEAEEQDMCNKVKHLLLCIHRMRVVSGPNEPWRVANVEPCAGVLLPDLRLKQIRKLITKQLIQQLALEQMPRVESMLAMKDGNGQNALDCALANQQHEIARMLDLNDPESRENLCRLIEIKIQQVLREELKPKIEEKKT
jgi:ankyrin repeat protein